MVGQAPRLGSMSLVGPVSTEALTRAASKMVHFFFLVHYAKYAKFGAEAGQSFFVFGLLVTRASLLSGRLPFLVGA